MSGSDDVDGEQPLRNSIENVPGCSFGDSYSPDETG